MVHRRAFEKYLVINVSHLNRIFEIVPLVTLYLTIHAIYVDHYHEQGIACNNLIWQQLHNSSHININSIKATPYRSTAKRLCNYHTTIISIRHTLHKNQWCTCYPDSPDMPWHLTHWDQRKLVGICQWHVHMHSSEWRYLYLIRTSLNCDVPKWEIVVISSGNDCLTAIT